MTNQHHPNPWGNLRAAIQYLLDCEGDGYQLCHYVVAVGIQRMDQTGSIASTSWLAIPSEQADYITQGLLDSAEEMRATQDIDDD
jgi:hypothetical protein